MKDKVHIIVTSDYHSRGLGRGRIGDHRHIRDRSSTEEGNSFVNASPSNTLNFAIEKPSVSTCREIKIMFMLILNVFKGSTAGRPDILDISQSFPQGTLVVSHFSSLLGEHK